MRYHYTKPDIYRTNYAQIYFCDHPLYNKCTLYKIGNRGLAVIQQRTYNKSTWWENIDPWLEDQIYICDGFLDYFKIMAEEPTKGGIYPTVTVRSIMNSLRLKPLPKERWETVFDRRLV